MVGAPVLRALITGATGFAGSHLVTECLDAGMEVIGTHLHDDVGTRDERATYRALDLQDAESVTALLREARPDRVFHLAAQAAVGAAWADPAPTLTGNLLLTLRILEATRLAAPGARLLYVSSSEVYGAMEGGRPLTEDQTPRPLSPYGVSKAAGELLAQQYARAYGLHVVIARPFNHIGPRQRRGFVLADFAAALVAMERGDAPAVLRVGNLRAARDFTDVRDVARAYRMALEDGTAGAVYNICSGRAVEIAALLEMLLGAVNVAIRVEKDPDRYRPLDRPAMAGSYTALHAATGWGPRITLEKSVADTLAYWRAEPSEART